MVKIREALPLLPDGTVDRARWLNRVSIHRTNEEVVVISAAFDLVQSIGTHQLTPLGTACFYQGLMMAEILHHLELDADTLAAAICCDAVQYGFLSLNKVETVLGEPILKLIANFQKIPKAYSEQTHRLENLRRLLLAIVEDVRVVLIKLAEHTCKMRSAVSLDETLRLKLSKETVEVYAPLANRLGIGQIKWELEDLAFRFQSPAHYKHIAKLLDEKRTDRERYIQNVIDTIQTTLKSQNIQAKVAGRAKHIYSIWKKMQRKGIGYEEIYDVRAFRILVPSIRDCYATLGLVHSLWTPIPKEFDDYIANPKLNGYRSLHTAVIGPEDKTLEVQIRTIDMHDQAELGVAAHWKYKEEVGADTKYEMKLASLRQVLSWQEEWFIGTEKETETPLALFQDRVYVLTPKGEVLDLPKGSTVLDFAYHIHSEIGNRCRGAKIAGKIVPLTQPLKSGDQVEIITAKSGGPSRDWLNPELKYLKTARARAKAQQWFKRQDREQNIVEGRDILERELKRMHLLNINLDQLAEKLHLEEAEDLFAHMGAGEIKTSQVMTVLQNWHKDKNEAENAPPISILKPKRSIKEPKRSHRLTEVIVEGVGNLMCQTARCCKPLPGDPIIGYITVGRGLTIHQAHCPNIEKADRNPERVMQVRWGEQKTGHFSVDILVKAHERSNLLDEIYSVFASEKITLTNLNTTYNRPLNLIIYQMTLTVVNLEILNTVLSRINHLENVIKAERQKL